MLYDKVQVEAIKLAVAGIERRGLMSKDILMESICWLREKYESIRNEEMLYKAVQHIYAYIELGFPFEEGREEFDKILKYLKIDSEDVFPEYMWKYSRVKITKCGIRNLLGRWNPRLHSMKISDVVLEIYNNVLEKKVGDYLYHSGRILTQNENEKLWEQTFWLYIREDEAIFFDVVKNKYYVFE